MAATARCAFTAAEERERAAAAQQLFNGPRGQRTAHRKQFTHRPLDPAPQYLVTPHPLRGRDFPALTPSERLHLEVNGYVVVEGVLTPAEVGALKEAVYAVERGWRSGGAVAGDPNDYTWFTSTTEDFFRVDNISHLRQPFYDYITHPRLLSMMEEIVGVQVRLEQSDAHIRRPPRNGRGEVVEEKHLGLHGGLRNNLGRAFQHTNHGLYHYSFVKTLTNLTDLGPDDGGTVVIPGSHKIDPTVDPAEVIRAAVRDPDRLLRRVVAPAGSTLVFFESTMHASGVIRSGRDRLLIISGWAPSTCSTWMGYQPDPGFLRVCPKEVRELLSGERLHMGQTRARHLGERVGAQSRATPPPPPRL